MSRFESIHCRCCTPAGQAPPSPLAEHEAEIRACFTPSAAGDVAAVLRALDSGSRRAEPHAGVPARIFVRQVKSSQGASLVALARGATGNL